MDGKISSRAFQRVFFFLEFWLIYYDFLKFSRKMDFFEFFGDWLTDAAGIENEGDWKLVADAND